MFKFVVEFSVHQEYVKAAKSIPVEGTKYFAAKRELVFGNIRVSLFYFSTESALPALLAHVSLLTRLIRVNSTDAFFAARGLKAFKDTKLKSTSHLPVLCKPQLLGSTPGKLAPFRVAKKICKSKSSNLV